MAIHLGDFFLYSNFISLQIFICCTKNNIIPNRKVIYSLAMLIQKLFPLFFFFLALVHLQTNLHCCNHIELVHFCVTVILKNLLSVVCIKEY